MTDVKLVGLGVEQVRFGWESGRLGFGPEEI